ncbi:MAG: hypothetical protein KBT46_02345, partial [Ruminococcus sp.]|nr:hypothetical protein [Candidatus Copronaster equi]
MSELLTLGEAGKWFTENFTETPASALCIDSDYSENGKKSLWYNCKNYRINMIYENSVHKYQPDTDNFKSEIADKYRINKDIYKEYVTYGVLRTEEEFIFYIDGKESGRSSNGATTDPAFMLLTCQ